MSVPDQLLTPEQRHRYDRDGFLSLTAWIDPAAVLAVRHCYDRLFAERAGREAGDHFDLAGSDLDGGTPALTQILEPARYAPELLETELFARCAALIGDLLGPTATSHLGHAICKPPGSPAATPWHQDAAYWDRSVDHPDAVSVWIPLQPVDTDSGCMEFVPASHRSRRVLAHRPIGDDPRVHGLELCPELLDRVVDPVACPLDVGGVTVHGGYTLHYTGPNRRTEPRRALIVMSGPQSG